MNGFPKHPVFQKIAILGPGLLGGSLALAIRASLPHARVHLWGRREEPLKLAEELDAAHLASTDLELVVREADLIVLATPVGIMPGLIEKILPIIKPSVLVTDVGSVKGIVHQTIGQLLTKAGIDFIGSHPMAGSEKQGMTQAKADLFKQATCLLTNDEHVHEDTIMALQRFWEAVGCNCIRMRSDAHDSTVARISHVPHVLAALCVHSALTDGDVERLGLISAGGFRDTTRISMGEPSMWAEILIDNAPAISKRLEKALAQLQQVQTLLNNGDKEALQQWLTRVREQRGQALGL